jgi:hypothetical protein
MEKTMSPYEIRQSRDGSINYDHYYARPVSLLSLPMRRFLRGSAALIAAGTIAVLVSAILVNASVSAQRLYCPSCEAPMHAADW